MILGIIPARYASSRFPGKPLADIDGKSMLRRVYDQAKQARLLDEVVIATDDDRIEAHAAAFGARVIRTREDHPSGTDRCQEAVERSGLKPDHVINIQGDEPFIDPGQIDLLASVLQQDTELATLIIKVNDLQVLQDPGEVKVALNTRGEALYFSRSVIPFIKGVAQDKWLEHHEYFRHVGMYAYRTDVLEAVSRLPVSALETAESLEQLRWLEHGYRVRCAVTEHDSHCVDTPEDLERVLTNLRKLREQR